MDKKTKVLVIVGPTAVGKTALSIEIAKKYKGEIISGDSMQIYRKLSIGTAKISPQEMEGIPHHLIDIREPDQAYSASLFQEMASQKIREITQRGGLPIIVGGTGLYIEGLLERMAFGGQGSHDEKLRQSLENRLQVEGLDALYEELVAKDPQAAQKIGRQNPRRLIRALEVIALTGKPFSQQEQSDQGDLDYLLVGLNTDRERLYARINERVDQMMAQGLLEEARWLLEQQYPEETQSLKAIGYKELFAYLRGEETLEEAVARLKQNSRRYAKRQLTWFRNRMAVYWVDLWQDGEKEKLLRHIADWKEEWKNR